MSMPQWIIYAVLFVLMVAAYIVWFARYGLETIPPIMKN